MITNTQRILYKTGYIPAYKQDTKHLLEYNGYFYKPKYKEIKGNKIWKIELETGCVGYFSPCYIKVGEKEFCNVSELSKGDLVKCYFPAFSARKSKDDIVAQKAAQVFLGSSRALKYIKAKYKIRDSSHFKLLGCSIDFISEFIYTLARELRENNIVRFYHRYQFLQDLYLALNLLGIESSMTRDREGTWYIEWSVNDMKDYKSYKSLAYKIKNIHLIEQDSQSYKIFVKGNQLITNSIIIKGD